MLILLIVALAAADAEARVPPASVGMSRVTLTPEQKSWFQQRARPFGATIRMTPNTQASEASRGSLERTGPAQMECTIRVLKADPDFDAGIARPAPPDLDPKIVRPSPCRK